MTAPFTRLGEGGYGVKRVGSFSSKTPDSGSGPHPVGIVTRLGEVGYGVRRYSSFAGKTTSTAASTSLLYPIAVTVMNRGMMRGPS